MTETDTSSRRYAGYALALLMFVYVMNFLDRQVIYILLPPIKSEMQLSDTQLAMLSAASFAIFYTLLGIPFGRLADRRSRTKLIAAGLAVWSLFSGFTGFAWDFWSIFLCRVGVGIGEATLGPAAISLLTDYFPPTKRATVTSIYSMGIAVGAGLAALFGGYLSQFGWRSAFFIIGFPGLAFAILVYFLHEPIRGSVATETSHASTDWKKLLSNKQFVLLCLGYALLGLATNNISVWGATYFNRVLNVSLVDYGYWAGILTLAAGIPATLFGGLIADRFRRRSAGGRMLYGAFLCVISIPCWLAVLFSSSFTIIIPAAVILLFNALGWLGAVAADATEIAGVNLRGLAVAIYFFSINVAAYLIGSVLIGKLSDAFGGSGNPSALRYALLVCPASCLLGGIILFIGSRRIGQESSQNRY